jgi:ketosteroid isomerase-like protein
MNPLLSAPVASAPIEASVTALVAFYEQLTPGGVAGLANLYAEEAYFKDPFNEVRGRAAVQHIFMHMFEALHEPRFVVTGRVVQGNVCFLTWDFHSRFKRFQPDLTRTMRGASHLVFDAAGRVAVHRDYWDPAEELYEKLPLLGSLMRWLKQRARR